MIHAGALDNRHAGALDNRPTPVRQVVVVERRRLLPVSWSLSRWSRHTYSGPRWPNTWHATWTNSVTSPVDTQSGSGAPSNHDPLVGFPRCPHAPVSGRPGTCARARTSLSPRKETGRLTTSPFPGRVGVAVADLELHRQDRDRGGRLVLQLLLRRPGPLGGILPAGAPRPSEFANAGDLWVATHRPRPGGAARPYAAARGGVKPAAGLGLEGREAQGSHRAGRGPRA
jgi:hypothetical protein